MFEWLFGKDEQPDLECSCCNEHVVFEGTTEELLRATQEAMNPPVEMPVEVPQEEETMEEVKGPSNDQVWTSIEFLKMAMEIEAAKNQRMVFYVDVGNLPKAKAEAYMKETEKNLVAKDGNYFLPRREGGRGTELTVTPPGRVTLEGVLATAQILKDFCTK